MIDLSKNPKAVDDVALTHNRILSGIKLLSTQPDHKSKLERIFLTIKSDRMQLVWQEYLKVESAFDIIINTRLINKAKKNEENPINTDKPVFSPTISKGSSSKKYFIDV